MVLHFLDLFIMAFIVFSLGRYHLTSEIPYMLCKLFAVPGFSSRMKPQRCQDVTENQPSLFGVNQSIDGTGVSAVTSMLEDQFPH